MKRIFAIILYVVGLLPYSLMAEAEPSMDSANIQKKWDINSSVALNINQLHLSNWAEGGESSMSGVMWFNFAAKHIKRKYSVTHQVTAGYGLLTNREKDIRKTEDRLEYLSSFSYKAFKNWNYMTQINFRTQFSNGYRNPNDSVIISTCMAPAYVTLSLGMQYKPSDFISVFISPASGKFTIVANQELADKGAYGVSPAVYVNDTLIAHGSMVKPEFGINLNASFKKEVFTNVSLESRLLLHNNYLDTDPGNRWNFDVNWDALINFTVNKTMSTTLRMNLIYDHNVKIKDYKVIDGQKTLISLGPRTQFKESFGIGISYKF